MHGRCSRVCNLSDESGVEPENDGGDDDHRSVVDHALLVARGEPAPLLEAVDAALHDVATRVGRLVEGQRATRSGRATRPLIAALRNRVRDLPHAEQPTTARVAVALVSDDPIWAGPRSSTPSESWDANAIQHRRQLRTVMAVAWRNDDRERSPLAITGQMKLAGQPAPAASEPLVGWVVAPLYIVKDAEGKCSRRCQSGG